MERWHWPHTSALLMGRRPGDPHTETVNNANTIKRTVYLQAVSLPMQAETKPTVKGGRPRWAGFANTAPMDAKPSNSLALGQPADSTTQAADSYWVVGVGS